NSDQANCLSSPLEARAPAIDARCADLVAARLPFAQSAVVTGTRGRCAGRIARLSGCGDGTDRIRLCVAAAGRTCRRTGNDGDRLAVALRARAHAQRDL